MLGLDRSLIFFSNKLVPTFVSVCDDELIICLVFEFMIFSFSSLLCLGLIIFLIFLIFCLLDFRLFRLLCFGRRLKREKGKRHFYSELFSGFDNVSQVLEVRLPLPIVFLLFFCCW